MPNKRHIIIDLDGTLIDSFDSICDSLSMTMEHFSLPRPATAFYITFRDKDLSSLFKTTYSLCEKNVSWKCYKTTFDDIYSHHCTENVSITSFGERIITCCKNEGVGMVVLTNKSQLAADIICTSLFPIHQFDFVIGRSGILPIKPYKRAMDRISQRLPLDSCKAYFGDSKTDEKMAEMMGIAYFDIHHTREEHIQTIIQSCIL